MSFTATLTNKRHLAAINAAWIATLPSDPEQPAPYASAQAYVQDALERVADSWADTTGVDRIPVGAFVRRFPGAVMDAVTASTDPNVIAILANLDAVTHVRLGHPTTLQGVGYLVAAGFMTQEQADAVLHYDIPTLP